MTNMDASNRRNQHLIFALLVGFGILFAASYTSRMIEQRQVQQQISLWENRIDEADAQQAELTRQLAYVQSEEYISEMARDELAQSQPGDQVIIIVPDEVRPADAALRSVGAEDAGTDAAAAPTDAATFGPSTAENATESTRSTAPQPIWQQWLGLLQQDGSSIFE